MESIQWKKIIGGNHRYLSELSEFNQGLPKGVINKTLPDVGGTYLCANCKYNYIIVCPTVDLVKSISEDKKNKYNVFECYGCINESDFNEFINNSNDEFIKIAVTYDKLKTLIKWIPNLNDYKVLVDEYHLLLQSMDFRENAIKNIIDIINLFDHVTFISATPINPKFEISELRNLDHYEILWDRVDKITPLRRKTMSVVKSLIKIVHAFNTDGLYANDINGDNSKIDELYIFLNSVNSIKQVCDTLNLNPDDVKICCSNRLVNCKILDRYTISDVTSQNKKINFFTSKCFQGCNLFTNNGLIIVCSDCNRKSMVTDLSSDLVQIAGRIRYNDEFQNKFRHLILHLYNTNSDIESDEEFELYMNSLKDECDTMLTAQNKLTDKERSVFYSKMNLNYSIISLNENNELQYSENKEMYFRYFHELKKAYRDGISVRKSYSDRFNETKQEVDNAFDIKLASLITISYQQIIKDYYNNGFKDEYTIEYPELKDFKKYISLKEANSLNYNRDKMLKMCESKSRLNDFIEKSFTEGFNTLKDIKKNLSRLFSENKITISPKASLIENVQGYTFKKTKKLVNGVMENGYLISVK